MTLGYMTGLDSNSATIKQQILARYIDKTILKNDILDSKQIAKIKNIMNKEILLHTKKMSKSKMLRQNIKKRLINTKLTNQTNNFNQKN